MISVSVRRGCLDEPSRSDEYAADRGDPGLESPPSPPFQPGIAIGLRLCFANPLRRTKDHLVHAHMLAALDAIEFRGIKMPGRRGAVIHLLAMRAAEVHGIGFELKFTGQERFAAFRALPCGEVPEGIFTGLAIHGGIRFQNFYRSNAGYSPNRTPPPTLVLGFPFSRLRIVHFKSRPPD